MSRVLLLLVLLGIAGCAADPGARTVSGVCPLIRMATVPVEAHGNMLLVHATISGAPIAAREDRTPIGDVAASGRGAARPVDCGASTLVTMPSAILRTRDAAALKRKTHVRTTIIQGEHAPPVVDDEDWTMATAHDEAPLRPRTGFCLRHFHQLCVASTTGLRRIGKPPSLGRRPRRRNGLVFKILRVQRMWHQVDGRMVLRLQ